MYTNYFTFYQLLNNIQAFNYSVYEQNIFRKNVAISLTNNELSATAHRLIQKQASISYSHAFSLYSSSGKSLTGGEIGALCMGIITALVIVFIVYTKWFKKPKKIKPQIIVVAPYDGKKKTFYNVSYFYEKKNISYVKDDNEKFQRFSF